MKNVVKQLVVAAVVLMVAAPAIAADTSGATRGVNKGSKSYQSARVNKTPGTTAQAPTTAEDVNNIAPAAGDTMDMPSEGKTMKETLRLPRKN